jgi:hypothetical protein
MPAGETFRTKTALAVELLRQADAGPAMPILGIFNGAYAVETVIAPCLHPEPGQRRIEVVTRLRADARLYHPVVIRARVKGRRPVWGPRMAAPQHHVYWPVGCQRSRAWVYGRMRPFQYKQLRCRWAVSGPEIPVQIVVVAMADYEPMWFLVTTALYLPAAQVVEAFTARFRQEDGIRDHKQCLGMEECRAWTKEPVRRTFQVQLVSLTLLRLLQARLEQAWDTGRWWFKPEWNRRKRHASILDLRRLFWRHRAEFSQFVRELEELKSIPQPPDLRSNPTGSAA